MATDRFFVTRYNLATDTNLQAYLSPLNEFVDRAFLPIDATLDKIQNAILTFKNKTKQLNELTQTVQSNNENAQQKTLADVHQLELNFKMQCAEELKKHFKQLLKQTTRVKNAMQNNGEIWDFHDYHLQAICKDTQRIVETFIEDAKTIKTQLQLSKASLKASFVIRYKNLTDSPDNKAAGCCIS